MSRAVALLIWAVTAAAAGAPANDNLLPCLSRDREETIEATVMKSAPTAAELLARLAYAEGRSTGFPADALVYEGIAWGVMNRVRLGEASAQMRRRFGDGIAGVIFRRGQFNPAVSPRSPHSGEFLCPKDAASWRLATTAATKAIQGSGNPFIQTSWEQAHRLSLVVNFYYPSSTQAKGPLAPWEASPGLAFIGEVHLGGGALPPERIRFYRLTQPPGNIAIPPAGVSRSQ